MRGKDPKRDQRKGYADEGGRVDAQHTRLHVGAHERPVAIQIDAEHDHFAQREHVGFVGIPLPACAGEVRVGRAAHADVLAEHGIRREIEDDIVRAVWVREPGVLRIQERRGVKDRVAVGGEHLDGDVAQARTATRIAIMEGDGTDEGAAAKVESPGGVGVGAEGMREVAGVTVDGEVRRQTRRKWRTAPPPARANQSAPNLLQATQSKPGRR